MYCGICGTSLSQPVKSRRERLIFFVTPVFLILICVAFAFELGVADPVDAGLLIAGSFVMLFLGSASIFGIFAWLFSMPVLTESYWLAGLFAVVQFVVCGFLSYNLEILMLGEVVAKMGPLQYLQARIEILAAVFLPTLLAGLIAVSARAKVVRFPEGVKNLIARFLIRNSLLIIPLVSLLVGLAMFFFQPDAVQWLIKARIAFDLEATDKALKLIDLGLERHNNYGPLHFSRGIVIIEGQPANLSPSDARFHLEKAVSAHPAVPLYRFRLSMAYDLEQRGEDAIAAASEATRLLPEDAYLWQHLGDLNLKYKQLPEAVTAFKTALKYTPEHPVLLNNLAYTLLELEQELPQALEMARMSVEKIPEMVFNLDTLAWAYFKNDRPLEALEVMDSVFEGRQEVSPEVDFHYAMILNRLKMLNNPLQTFDTMLARPEVAADHQLFEQILIARNQEELNPTVTKQKVSPDQSQNGESVNEE